MCYPLLLFFQLFFQFSGIILWGRAIWHCIIRCHVLIFPIFCGLRTESTLTKFLCHHFFLNQLLLLTTFWIISKFINRGATACNGSRDFVYLRFECILGIDFSFYNFPHNLLLLLVFTVETHNSFLRSFNTSVGITFNYDFRSSINFWFKWKTLFVSPFFACFFSFFVLSLNESFLAIIKIFHVALEHVILSWEEGWWLGDMRMKRIFFINVLVNRYVMIHLFLNSIISIAIQTLNNRICLFCWLFDNCYFLRLFIDLRLEREFFLLFLFTLDSELLKFFILLFLKFRHSFVNRITIFKLVKIYNCNSRIWFRLIKVVWRQYFRMKTAIFHLLLFKFTLKLFSLLFFKICFMKKPLWQW